jgi:DNA-binding transcriptional ArsR family regulator
VVDAEERRSLAAELLLRELVESSGGRSVRELEAATLLPEPTVRETLSELTAAGVCTRHDRGGDRRYVLASGWRR